MKKSSRAFGKGLNKPSYHTSGLFSTKINFVGKNSGGQ